MTDDEFIAIAVKANEIGEDYAACNDPERMSRGDIAWGWSLNDIAFLPDRGRRLTRIRLLGYDLSTRCGRDGRKRMCFASIDRVAKNAAKLLYRLTMAVAGSVPHGVVRRPV